MVAAEKNDKEAVVDILVQSFRDNNSVNYVVKQGIWREQRLWTLMRYAHDMCRAFGKVYLSEDKQACALLMFQDQKRTTLRTVFWDIRLLFRCIGFANLHKAIQREKQISKLHPPQPFCYLWFIGVAPDAQGKGKGSGLLKEIIEEATRLQRPVYLETSTERNVNWYNRFGFVLYRQLCFGYKLYCLKREAVVQREKMDQ